jgi:hypothetical protein
MNYEDEISKSLNDADAAANEEMEVAYALWEQEVEQRPWHCPHD